MADIKELATTKQYEKDGIFYKQNDQDIRKGKALVFGPEGTPYEDCPMFFDFEITEAFPLEPPKVTFGTYDATTRFHPNLYIGGKVCLSILHTWDGPKWASTMRLSTVLVTIQSLLDNDPLKHEPGMPSTAPFEAYAKLVEARCIQYILRVASVLLHKSERIQFVEEFEEVLRERLEETLKRLIKRLEKLVEGGEHTWAGLTYGMTGFSGYQASLARARIAYQKLKG